jgi:NAD(P)-dependent dehydrogenase (short-subunit alcohol dehydrogenase family)
MTHAEKVVIVTGAGSGIGRATALRSAQRGAQVAVVDRDEVTGPATAQLIGQAGGTAHFVCADVADEKGVLAYVAETRERFGRIDCLFNNAGIEGSFQPTWQYDTSAFERVMAANVTSIFLGMRHVLPIMIAAASSMPRRLPVWPVLRE